MNEVSSAFTCKICETIFVKPVILPCLNTICEEHTKDYLLSSCVFCGGFHDVPKDGFKRNEMARLFIKSNFYLNETEKEIKTELDKESIELNALFDKFVSQDDESERILSENFASIKEKINHQRNNLKNEVDMIADKMIKRTEQNEIECKDKLEHLKTQWLVNNKESLNALKENIDDDFIKAKIQQEKIEVFKKETQKIISDLKIRLARVEGVKKRIDSCFFETGDSHLENTMFGNLLVEINEFKLASCSGDRSIKIWDANSGGVFNKKLKKDF